MQSQMGTLYQNYFHQQIADFFLQVEPIAAILLYDLTLRHACYDGLIVL